jgi:hypothetical protein
MIDTMKLTERCYEILNTLLVTLLCSRLILQRVHCPCNNFPWEHRIFCDCYISGHRGYKTVCDALKVLTDSGAITSYRLDRKLRIHEGNIYVLAPSYSRQLLRDQYNPATLSERRKLNQIVRRKFGTVKRLIFDTPVMLPHRLFTTDCYAWFRLSQIDCLERFDIDYELYSLDTSVRTIAPEPDLTVRISHPVFVTIYVECDRGTETYAQLQQKFRTYRRLLDQQPKALLVFIEERPQRDLERLFTLSHDAEIIGQILFSNFSEFKHLNLFSEFIWHDMPNSRVSLNLYLNDLSLTCDPSQDIATCSDELEDFL